MTIYDVLVVGGGPAGTAAAFRARELGLEPIVIDYDDLMKRIRDYSKDKLILPSFGGGDAMCFPKGGDLVSALHFSPIDKDEMCACWKGLYEQHKVPTRIGLELTQLEPLEAGWRASAWSHAEQCEETLEARTVVVAVGRGVPRHFDIPGNTEGIAFKLADASAYVGAPACVIGGGTSAAEAVIAVSNAKAAANDPTAVYWSYRGDKMPRISKALAEVFFEAYVGHGNIRYFPKSEPAAVLTGDDRQDYLAVRVDRRRMDGRPSETVHLEFPKKACVACIGEDLPEKLLDAIGSPLVTGGPRAKRRVVVSRHLETRQPGIYLAGDLLSQAYLETDDFDADPAGFREVKHRGNVKSALRDGVLVAEVIKQRLDGKTEIEVHIEDADEPHAPSDESSAVASLSKPAAAGGPPAASDETREPAVDGAVLIHLLPTGVEENEYPVRERGLTSFGSGDCDIAFPNDSMMSAAHGSISHGEDGFLLRDDGSSTGVFLQLSAARKHELVDGDLIQIGRQFLRLSRGEDGASVTHYDAGGAEVGRHQLGERVVIVGRQAPGASLDADDSTLSRRHLALSLEAGKVVAKDLKSLNGSYLRVRSAVPLAHGDRFRAGGQRFVFSLEPGAVFDEGHARPAETSAGAVPEEAKEAQEASADGPTVTFKGTGKTVAISKGESVCAVAERCGITINAECHSGICGSDPVRIISGKENVVSEAGDQERETLEDLCELEPGECRLACLLEIKGPIEVEIL